MRSRLSAIEGRPSVPDTPSARQPVTYLKTPDDKHFEIDEQRVAEDARYDGLYVLRTNMRLDALAVMPIFYSSCGSMWRKSLILLVAG